MKTASLLLAIFTAVVAFGLARSKSAAIPETRSVVAGRSLSSAVDREAIERNWVQAGSWSAEVNKTIATHYSWPPFSLCDLINAHGPVGQFRVSRMVSQIERKEGFELPFTYVTFYVMDGIRGVETGKEVVIRLEGGLRPDGSMMSSQVQLTVGDDFFTFIDPITTNNNGLMRLSAIGVFRRSGSGGYTNGQLFSDGIALYDLRKKVQERLQRCDDNNDIRPVFTAPHPRSDLPSGIADIKSGPTERGQPGDQTPGPNTGPTDGVGQE